jgi:tRNA (guanine37-N1)-methyltransferase
LSTPSSTNLRVAIVTLFPELFGPFLSTGFVKKALSQGVLAVHLQALRNYGLGTHRSVDDTPYGGGSGMVMRVDVLVSAVEGAEAAMGAGRMHRVLLTPQGRPFDQRGAEQLSGSGSVMLICGRYEGFDERVRDFVDQELSIGDFILTGGEVAAMAVVEACVRLLPGVLGNEQSCLEESFSGACRGLLEYPQYTRPPAFRGLPVPELLLSGDHGQVAQWRHQQSLERTRLRRPDLIEPRRRAPDPAETREQGSKRS